MARQPRFFVRGNVLHIIQRGNDRAPIFASDQDLRFFLSCLDHARDRHQLTIHAYETDATRARAYRALFRIDLSGADIDLIRETTNKNWVLGNERFKRQIEELTGRRVSPARRGSQPESSSAIEPSATLCSDAMGFRV